MRTAVSGRLTTTLRGLALACHPLPSVAVTSLTTALAVAAGVRGWLLVLLLAAVLSGQLCVGWVNDLLDVEHDRAAARRDKPIAERLVSPRIVARAAAVAGALCIPLSLALGIVPGTLHLVAVAAALVYNRWLKHTAWSFLPYAVDFGLLPVVVWMVSGRAGLPPGWLVMAGALLGLGAHGANVLPDYERDRAAGVRGLPHRLPLPLLRVAAVAAFAAALVLLAVGPPGPVPAWEFVVLGAAAALGVVSAAAPAESRVSFPAAIGVAALAVAVFVARGAFG